MPLIDQRIARRYFLLLFVLIAAAYAINGNKLMQAGGLDAFIYTSLIKDYSNIIDRYGAAYYATRIAYIFPSHILHYFFSDAIAYHLSKILFFSISVCSVFFISYRIVGSLLAFLIAAWAAFSPQFVRPFLWDHYEGAGFAYHLAALACVVVAAGSNKRSAFLLCGLAGVLLALSINVNPTLVAICGAMVLAAVALEWPSFKTIAYKIMSAAGGFFVMYAIMIVYMRINYPVFGPIFEAVTFGMTKWGVSGGAANWYVPISTVLATPAGIFCLSPFIVLAALAITIIRDGSWRSPNPIMVASLIYLALVCGFFLWAHFVVKSILLHTFYYNIYMVPAMILAMVALARAAMGSGESQSRLGILSLAAVSVALLIGARLIGGGVTQFLLSLDTRLVIAAFVVVALATALTTALPRAVAFSTLMLMVSVVQMSNSAFSSINSVQNKAQEWDVYNGTNRLVEIVKQYAPKQEGTVGFWYSNLNSGPEIYLNSVQSAFLWGYSRVHPAASTEQGMPVLNEIAEQRIQTFRFIVVQSTEEQKVEAGLAELARKQIKYHVLVRGKQFGPAWGYHYAVLDMRKPD